MESLAPFRPNMLMVQFVFDNVWSVDQLEKYVTSYQPGGVPLPILRRALGYRQADVARYALTLSKTAAVLYALGHIKTVPEVLLELLLRLNPLHLTLDQVLFLSEIISGRRKEKGGGGTLSKKKTSLKCSILLQDFVNTKKTRPC
jgi:hypothetical protein